EAGILAARMNDVARNLESYHNKLCFNVNLQDIASDGEWVDQLYKWTSQHWKEIDAGQVFPIEFELAPTCKLLSDYLGKEPRTVGKKLLEEWKTPGSTVRDAWNQAHPKTDDEIVSFYRNSNAYLYDLLIVHKTHERQRRREAAATLFSKYGVKKLLDYGGG